MPRTGVGSPPSDPTQALRRSGVLFVRDESGIRLDLQLADVGFDESAIQRTVEIELEPPGRICTAGLNASFRTKSRQSKNIRVILLHYPTQSYILHIMLTKKSN